MIKNLAIGFFCFNFLAMATTDIMDIRLYHQQLEEKVFELENKETEDEKIKESFLLGQKRIKDAIKNEKVILESKGLTTSEKLTELEIFNEKYNKILAQYEKLSKEKERLILENSQYKKQLNALLEVKK